MLTVPYTVTDDQGATSTANLVITVTGTNDAPVAQAAGVQRGRGCALISGSVAATDADSRCGDLTSRSVGAAPAGLTFNADGSYSFDAANAAYSRWVSASPPCSRWPYTVTDDQGATHRHT